MCIMLQISYCAFHRSGRPRRVLIFRDINHKFKCVKVMKILIVFCNSLIYIYIYVVYIYWIILGREFFYIITEKIGKSLMNFSPRPLLVLLASCCAENAKQLSPSFPWIRFFLLGRLIVLILFLYTFFFLGRLIVLNISICFNKSRN